MSDWSPWSILRVLQQTQLAPKPQPISVLMLESHKKPDQSIFRSACSDGLPHDGEAGKSCGSVVIQFSWQSLRPAMMATCSTAMDAVRTALWRWDGLARPWGPGSVSAAGKTWDLPRHSQLDFMQTAGAVVGPGDWHGIFVT